MKTPITYWGGKTRMLKDILPLIPPHDCYIEPFLGGGAVFFAKTPAKINIINDKNGEIVNFYRVIFQEEKRKELVARLEYTPYAESIYHEVCKIYKNPLSHDDITRAWALFVGLNTSWSRCMARGYSAHAKNNKAKMFQNKIENELKTNYGEALKNTQICNRDALIVIMMARSKKDFIYIDPPYIEAEQGHYAGYTKDEFEALLKVCEATPGNFMLSSYPSEILADYIKRNKWDCRVFEKCLSSSRKEKKVIKTEVLTMNYKAKGVATELF